MVQRYILFQHNKKTYSHLYKYLVIVKQLHTPEKFNFIVLSANIITSLPTLIIVYSKLRLTPLPFFFGRGGAFFKVNFLVNYTSNEAQTKLKTLVKV